MQRSIFETVFGAVVLLVAAVFVFFFYETTDIAPTEGYEITAQFSQIDGLSTGSAVKISGVKVGQVTKFELNKETFQAIVHMNIDSDILLPNDTAALVVSAGLLDGKFLTLEPGGSEDMMAPGDMISFTQSSPSLEQLLGQVIFSLTKGEDKGPKTMAPEMP